MAAARAAFLDYYGANLATQSRPFAGVRETLTMLATSAGPLGVCTNKPERLSRCLFDALDLTRFFSAVLGGDSLAVRKPDPEHLWATIDALGAGRSEAVMVGDSANDVATARNAGVPVIVVSYGYRDAPAAALGADAVIDSFAALPAALERLG
jgi:phosphoglycolate phosphatase